MAQEWKITFGVLGPKVDLTKYKRDVYLMLEEAIIKATRDVYRSMVEAVPFATGQSQGAVSNLAGAKLEGKSPSGESFKGTQVGNPNAAGANSPRIKVHPITVSKSPQRKLLPTKNFFTGQHKATPPVNILQITVRGVIHFKFAVDIGYWLATKPQDNSVWGALDQYAEIFKARVLEYFKPPGLKNYMRDRSG
jgi:hypothetical protein